MISLQRKLTACTLRKHRPYILKASSVSEGTGCPREGDEKIASLICLGMLNCFAVSNGPRIKSQDLSFEEAGNTGSISGSSRTNMSIGRLESSLGLGRLQFAPPHFLTVFEVVHHSRI